MLSRRFTAAYDGYCGSCGSSIWEGDTIRMEDGTPLCEDCWGNENSLDEES